jgi:hypothetical protein
MSLPRQETFCNSIEDEPAEEEEDTWLHKLAASTVMSSLGIMACSHVRSIRGVAWLGAVPGLLMLVMK